MKSMKDNFRSWLVVTLIQTLSILWNNKNIKKLIDQTLNGNNITGQFCINFPMFSLTTPKIANNISSQLERNELGFNRRLKNQMLTMKNLEIFLFQTFS
jgi:hypothetical protein